MLSTLQAQPDPPFCCPGTRHPKALPQPRSLVTPFLCSSSQPHGPAARPFLVPLQQPLECGSPLGAGGNRLGVVSACGCQQQKAPGFTGGEGPAGCLLPEGIQLLPHCVPFPQSPATLGLWVRLLPCAPATPVPCVAAGAGPAAAPGSQTQPSGWAVPGL